jgi:hypothetical protein
LPFANVNSLLLIQFLFFRQALSRRTASETLLIGGQVSDNTRVESLKIKARGGRWEQVASRGRWIVKPRLKPGKNVFYILATDAAGNQTMERVTAVRYR